MSTTDAIIINPLERGIDADINDLQSYAGRHVGELARFNAGMYPPSGGSSNAMERVGGLAMSVSAGDIVVAPGYLMQISDTLPTPVGPLDSPARVGLLLEAETLDVPDLGGGVVRYYLVQARVTETVVDENRDLFNETTQDYEPPASIPKRRILGVEVELKLGTTEGLIPTADSGWLAIGAVYKSAATAITGDGLVDLRPLPAIDQVGMTLGTLSSASNSCYPICREMRVGFADQDVVGRFSAMVNGFLATVRTPNGGVDIGQFKHSSDADQAGRWYYIYLGQNPRGVAIGGFARGRAGNAYALLGLPDANCVVALSRVLPSSRGINSGNVTLVTPFEGLTLPEGTMVCVGAVRRNAANDGWDGLTSSAGGDVTFVANSSDAQIIDQNWGSADGANNRVGTIDLFGTGGLRVVPPAIMSVSGFVQQIDIDTTTGTKRIVHIDIETSAGLLIEPMGMWNTRERAGNQIHRFDVASPGEQIALRLRALTDADVPVPASTSAIGATNRWAITVTGFRW